MDRNKERDENEKDDKGSHGIKYRIRVGIKIRIVIRDAKRTKLEEAKR